MITSLARCRPALKSPDRNPVSAAPCRWPKHTPGPAGLVGREARTPCRAILVVKFVSSYGKTHYATVQKPLTVGEEFLQAREMVL